MASFLSIWRARSGDLSRAHARARASAGRSLNFSSSRLSKRARFVRFSLPSGIRHPHRAGPRPPDRARRWPRHRRRSGGVSEALSNGPAGRNRRGAPRSAVRPRITGLEARSDGVGRCSGGVCPRIFDLFGSCSLPYSTLTTDLFKFRNHVCATRELPHNKLAKMGALRTKQAAIFARSVQTGLPSTYGVRRNKADRTAPCSPLLLIKYSLTRPPCKSITLHVLIGKM